MAISIPRTSIEEAFVSRREAPDEADEEVTFVRPKEKEVEPQGPVTPGDLARLDMAKRSLKVLGHCEDVPRPCPFVSCRHNLYLDVDTKTGSIRLNFPLIEPGEMPANASCAMDLVEHRGLSTGAIAELLNEGEAQVELIERRNRPLLQEGLSEYRDHSTASEEPATPLGALAGAMQGGVEKGLTEDEEDRSGRVLPDRLFFHELPRHHQLQQQLEKGVVVGVAALGSHGLREAAVDDDEYERALWKVYERSSKALLRELKLASDVFLEGGTREMAAQALKPFSLDPEVLERRLARAEELAVERKAARAKHGKRRSARGRQRAS